MAATGTDPRIGSDAGVRPVVALPRAGLPNWAIAVGVALAALLLFSVLEARRQSASAPAVKPRHADDLGTPAPVPPLFIPPERLPPAQAVVVPPLPPAEAFVLPTPPSPPPRRDYTPPPMPITAPPMMPSPVTRGAGSQEPALVFDSTVGEAGPDGAPGATAASGGASLTGGRSRATVMRNRETTVPQGTLIPAVLETAFDSTRPGLARALVARDVRGFDGSRVLIPRGSRLIGEYQADLQSGQNRALVTWTRLVRPDGVMIAIGSPAADPLGRAGVRGKVDSHFFERFGAAILQSALDIGVNLASRAGNDDSSVIVALPGAAQAANPLANTGPVQPTLRIKQGTAITVFVARDLDFTAVERRR